jgi:hypothetical protein
MYEHPGLGHVYEMTGNRPFLYKDCFDTLQELASQGLQLALEGSSSGAIPVLPTTINTTSIG